MPQSWSAAALSGSDLDITSRAAVLSRIIAERPSVVFNTAAYTKVDQAEQERERAFAVNEQGVANLAEACAATGCRLIHISTDYVFDGDKNRPYQPKDETSPINAYGASKLAGEKRALELLPNATVIFRTAWLYSITGTNFVRTILELISERERLGVVADQVGSPTWATGLASVLWIAADDESVSGILHWTDAGAASWYDFAIAIQQEGEAAGVVTNRAIINPITTAEYPTLAARPRYSALDSSETSLRLGVEQKPWRLQLRSMVGTLRT
jgi:dTDP-4-dehydrorhamnose reductase